MVRARSVALALLSSAAVAILVSACGTNAVGIDACRRIEDARCQQAPACPIPLQPPYHQAGSDVDECLRFYDTACMHGLASGSDPGSAAVDACVHAIESNGCATVSAPERDPACAFLLPPPPPPDASAPTGDADAAAPGDAGHPNAAAGDS